MQEPEFEIALNDVVFILEANGLLESNVPLNSQLRNAALQKAQKINEKIAIPVYWNSKSLDKYPTREEKSKNIHADCLPEFLFVATKGIKFNSNLLLPDVLSKGGLFVAQKSDLDTAMAATFPQKEWQSTLTSHPHCLVVSCEKKALYQLLMQSKQVKENGLYSVLVTGTNGKTSVVQLLGNALAKTTNQGTAKIGTLGIQLNNETVESSTPTMPPIPEFVSALSAMQDKKIQNLVMEATSQGLHQTRIGSFQADTVVFTNFTQDHLDYHKTMDSYLQAKLILFKRHLKKNGCAVVNCDDKNWKSFAEAAQGQAGHLIGYGQHQAKEDWLCMQPSLKGKNNFLEFSINEQSLTTQGAWKLWQGQESHKEIESRSYKLPLVGHFQHSNIAAVAAVLSARGVSLAEIEATLATHCEISGRMQPIFPLIHALRLSHADKHIPMDADKVTNDAALPTVLLDYAHSPDALEKALEVCKKTKRTDSKVWCVFGCGGDRDKSKRPLMGKIAAALADIVLITSDNPRTEEPSLILEDIKQGTLDADKGKLIRLIVNRKDAIAHAISNAAPQDIILIAGKGHENYQIIGTEKTHFSDSEAAQDLLTQLVIDKRQKVT